MENVKSYNEFINEWNNPFKTQKKLTLDNLKKILLDILGEFESNYNHIPTFKIVLKNLIEQGYEFSRDFIIHIKNQYEELINRPTDVFDPYLIKK
jgi:predicted RNA-binding protein with PIN domain